MPARLEKTRFIWIYQLMRTAKLSAGDIGRERILSTETMTGFRAGTCLSHPSLTHLATALERARISTEDAIAAFCEIGVDAEITARTLEYADGETVFSCDSLVEFLGNPAWRTQVNDTAGKITGGTCAIEHVYFLVTASPEVREQFAKQITSLKVKRLKANFEAIWKEFLHDCNHVTDAGDESTRGKYWARTLKGRSIGDAGANNAHPFGHEDAEKVRKTGTDTLYSAIVTVLQSDVLRTFILGKNGLASDLSAEQLADKIVATTPTMLPTGEPSTAMSYLAKCRTPPLPDQAIRREVLEGVSDLIGLFAPLSFAFPDTLQFAALAKQAADASHASAACTRPLIGASILALFLGKPVDIEVNSLVKDNNIPGSSFMDSWGKLHMTDAAPLLGSDEKDLINAIAIGLHPLIGAVDSSLTYVKARLQELDSQQRTSVCIWFPRLMMDCDLELVKKEFPLVFALVCNAKDDEQINAAVVTQIHSLLRFVKDNK